MAVNVIGLPLTFASDAVTVALVPGAVGSVQEVSVAIPFAPVVMLAGLAGTMVPPPEAVNVTAAPDTGLPAASLMITDGKLADGTDEPAGAASCVLAFGAMLAAAPAPTLTFAVADVRFPEEKVIVTGPTGPLTPRLANVAVPDASVLALVEPTNVYGVPTGTDAATLTLGARTAFPNASRDCT